MYGASSTGNSWNILAAESSVGSNTIIPNQWNHFVLCRTGNTFSGFLNGERDLTTTSSAGIISRTEGYTVGAWFSTLYYFSGYISNFRFIVGSTPYDATGVTITVPTAPLTAVTSTSLLLLGTNAGIYDSAMQNNLTTVGDAKISTTQSKFGGSSIYFDGTGDYLQIPYSPNFTMNSNFTAECWVYITSAPNAYGGILAFSNDSEGVGWNILIGGNPSKFHFNVALSYTDTDTSLTLNTWTHLALVRSGSTVKLYINGVADANTLTTSATATCPTNPQIGSYPLISGRTFFGYIDDIRITKGYARYTTTFTPPTSALLRQ
jgi:hypothetical protein